MTDYINNPSAGAVVGAIVEYVSDDNYIGVLPANGDAFKLTDYPELAIVLPGGLLPTSNTIGAAIVTGVSGASSVNGTVNTTPVPFTSLSIIPKGFGVSASNGWSIGTNGNGIWIASLFNSVVVRSTDNGLTWAALPSNLGLVHGSSFNVIRTDRKGTWIAGGAADSTLARSTDNGETWNAIQYFTTGGRTVRSLDTDNNGVWVAGLDDGYAARSTDNGETWTALARGLSSGSIRNNRTLYTDRKGTWIVGMDDGYAARSTDNGATWNPLPRGLNSGDIQAHVYRIDTDESGVWVACKINGYASRSTDNGLTWTALPRGLNSGGSSIYSLRTDRKGTWIVGMDAGYITQSLDNGVTWSALPRGLTNAVVSNISDIDVGDDGVWVAIFLDSNAERFKLQGTTTKKQWTLS